MDRRVVWTAAASYDLEEAAAFIRRDSRHYAAAFVRDVRDAASSLKHFSERGRIVPEFHDSSLRELIIRSYRLVYRVRADRVVIFAFFHGARRFPPGRESLTH